MPLLCDTNIEAFIEKHRYVLGEPIPSKIHWIDSTMFNGDLIMKLRLKYLYPHVDKFYICEQRYTHQGTRKTELFFDKCKEWFIPYLDKILFIVDETFYTGGSSVCELAHRNYSVTKILEDMKDKKYIVSVCDCDEIPDHSIVMKERHGIYTKTSKGALHMSQELFYYNFTCKFEVRWESPFFINDSLLNIYKNFSNFRSGHIPCLRETLQCGWHCSYFMSNNDIVRKLQSFCHPEYNTPEYTNKEFIEKCITNRISLFEANTNKTIAKNPKRIDEYPDEFQEFQTYITELQGVANEMTI